MESRNHSKNWTSLKNQMSKVITFLLCIPLFLASCNTPKIYTKPNVADYTIRHRTLAIMPVTKNVIQTQYTDRAKSSALSYVDATQTQEDMASEFYYYIMKNKMRIEVQDIEKTNRILEDAGFFKVSTKISPQELAAVLGVDAVLFSNYQLKAYKNITSGIMLIVGSIIVPFAWYPYGIGVTPVWLYYGISDCVTVHESNEVVLKLYDGRTGDLLWNYNHLFIDKSTGKIMREVVWKMPYYRK